MGQAIIRVVAAALLAALPCAAFSWDECLPLNPDQRFACLSGQEVEKAGNLNFELALADAARLSGNTAYAAIVLERVVTRYPNQAGARLDLVVLSLQAGDTLTASRHLKILEAMPNPPAAVASLIKRLNRQLKPADKVFDSQIKYQASAGIGYDTNPNLGVLADAIDLVINGSPVSLVPDQSFSPQQAFFAGLSGGFDYSYSPRGLISVSGSAREYEGLENEDSVAIAARLFHRIRSNRYIEAVLADFRTGEGLYLSRAGVGMRQRFSDCECSTVGVLVDVLESSEQSSDASRVKLELETFGEWGISEYLLYGSVGYDVQSEADWGNTTGIQLGADAGAHFRGFKASIGVSMYKGFDEDPYSPLFEDSKRDLFRGVVRAGVSHPVAPGMELFLDWSWSRQESDIVLFDYRRQVSAIGLRLKF